MSKINATANRKMRGSATANAWASCVVKSENMNHHAKVRERDHTTAETERRVKTTQ